MSVALVPGLVLGGHYHLVSRLGEGRQGSTWAVTDSRDGAQRVAVVMALPTPLDLASHEHGSVEHVLAVWWEQAALLEPCDQVSPELVVEAGWCLVVYPAMAGCPLSAWCAQRDLDATQVARWGEQLGDLVRRGRLLEPPLAFGDIDVASVWADERGELRLLAPGLVRNLELLARARRRGKEPHELAPPLDPRGDVYAVAEVLWSALTGQQLPERARRLFEAEPVSLGEALQARRPQLPEVLGATLASCLELEPARRPACVDELDGLWGQLARGTTGEGVEPPEGTAAAVAAPGSAASPLPPAAHVQAGTDRPQGQATSEVSREPVSSPPTLVSMPASGSDMASLWSGPLAGKVAASQGDPPLRFRGAALVTAMLLLVLGLRVTALMHPPQAPSRLTEQVLRERQARLRGQLLPGVTRPARPGLVKPHGRP